MKKVTREIKILIYWLIGIVVLAGGIFYSRTEQSMAVPQEIYTRIAVDQEFTGDLNILDKELEGKEIIFTAEFHGVKANMELELKFLKYLKEKTNFKYYLCELSYAQAMMLNQFLETGDQEILDELYSHYKGTYGYTKDNYERWLTLYEYNKQFDKQDKIKVVGVDVEHQIDYALDVIKGLLPEEAPSEEIAEKINTLKVGANNTELIKEIHQDLIEKEEVYKAYLGERYLDIEMIVRNIKNVYYVKEKDELFNVRRDAVIYENFMDIYSTLEKGVFYGQWGHNHTYQVEEGGVKWFAAALEEGMFNDKILTVAYTYDNCKFMNKKGDGEYDVQPMDTFSGYEIKDGDKETALLFNVQDGNSMFEELNQYFQYLLLISDSEATEPLSQQH